MNEQPRWSDEQIESAAYDLAGMYVSRDDYMVNLANKIEATMKQIRDDLTQQLAALTAENKQRLKGAGKRIAALEEKNERLTVALEEYETSNFFYQNAAGKHLGYILTLEQRIADLETARAALQAENDRLKEGTYQPVEAVDPDASDGFFGVVTLEFIIDDTGKYVCEDMAEGLALCRWQEGANNATLQDS